MAEGLCTALPATGTASPSFKGDPEGAHRVHHHSPPSLPLSLPSPSSSPPPFPPPPPPPPHHGLLTCELLKAKEGQDLGLTAAVFTPSSSPQLGSWEGPQGPCARRTHGRLVYTAFVYCVVYNVDIVNAGDYSHLMDEPAVRTVKPPLESERGAGCCCEEQAAAWRPDLCWGHPLLSLWPPCHDRGSSPPCQEGSLCLSLRLPPSHLLCSPVRDHGPHLAPGRTGAAARPRAGRPTAHWGQSQPQKPRCHGRHFGLNCL